MKIPTAVGRLRAAAGWFGLEAMAMQRSMLLHSSGGWWSGRSGGSGDTSTAKITLPLEVVDGQQLLVYIGDAECLPTRSSSKVSRNLTIASSAPAIQTTSARANMIPTRHHENCQSTHPGDRQLCTKRAYQLTLPTRARNCTSSRAPAQNSRRR